MLELDVIRNRFTDEEIELLLKKLDYLIYNWGKLSERNKFNQIINLRDLLDRWG